MALDRFKQYGEFINRIDQRVSDGMRNAGVVRTKLAQIVSIQSGTVTVRFETDTFDLAGVILPSNITVIVGDKVRITNANNTFQGSAWKIDSVV